MPQRNVIDQYIDALPEVAAAENPHQAVGLWWAHNTADPQFAYDLAVDERTEKALIIAQNRAVRNLRLIGPHLMQFAGHVEDLSRRESPAIIKTTFAADELGLLWRAAQLAGMPIDGRNTFPPNCSSEIRDDQVIVRPGLMGIEERVWPPES